MEKKKLKLSITGSSQKTLSSIEQAKTKNPLTPIWVSYSKVIGFPGFSEFLFGKGFSGQEWFQWIRGLSFHRKCCLLYTSPSPRD